MSFHTIERDGAVVLTLDRPPVNALTPDLVVQLTEFFSGYDDPAPLILTGTGDIFCAGVDTNAFKSASEAERVEFFNAITRMTASLVSIPSPVLAALNGHALGGGFVLALCADFRIAVEGPFKFGLPEAKAGVPFPKGPAEIIRTELPGPLLRALTLSSRIATLDELLRHAVLDDAVEPGGLMNAAHAYAKALRAQPAFKAVKRQMRGRLAQRLHQLV